MCIVYPCSLSRLIAFCQLFFGNLSPLCMLWLYVILEKKVLRRGVRFIYLFSANKKVYLWEVRNDYNHMNMTHICLLCMPWCLGQDGNGGNGRRGQLSHSNAHLVHIIICLYT